MNDPVGQTEPPASYLKIQGDPTSWGLPTVPPQDPDWNDGPIALDIIRPVTGTLILSPARLGSFALTAGIFANGWVGTVEILSPHLYIPTASGLKPDTRGYPLAPQYDNLPALQQSIMDAMTTGSTLPVNIDVPGGGVVILNGAQLPFAVLAEVQIN
jgi:hypothetical protein